MKSSFRAYACSCLVQPFPEHPLLVTKESWMIISMSISYLLKYWEMSYLLSPLDLML